MPPRDPFNSAEMKKIELISAYEQYADDVASRLGQVLAKNIITVVQNSDLARPTEKHANPILNSSYVIYAGGPQIPSSFSPPETSEPGYGDRLIFLKPNQATTVINDGGESELIVNRDGVAQTYNNTAWRRKRLNRQGINFSFQSEPALEYLHARNFT